MNPNQMTRGVGDENAQQAHMAQNLEFEVLTLDSQGSVTERTTRRAQQFAEDLGSGIVLELVAIPAGVFLMGSPKGKGYEDEHPQHAVTLALFRMGRYLVTQEQWKAVMGTTARCRFQGARRPVENISWQAARQFCVRLSKVTGRVYRLPSEAEWEYACRGRTTTPFYCGQTITTELANYCGDHTYLAEPKGLYRHETTTVGSFPPNAFGLYDMHGNLWEWCEDIWHESYAGALADGRAWESGGNSTYRPVRGGSWHDTPDVCRCAARSKFDPAAGDDFVGFRVASASLDGSLSGAPFTEAAR